MYYNPMANLFLRLLGQAAAQTFADQSRRAGQDGQGYNSPFDEMFSAEQQAEDDSPIDVEAEVVDEDGKTTSQRAHEQWDAQRAGATAGGALGGEVAFAGSKRYNIATIAIGFALLLCGVIARIYSLVMGNIFSATIVPVALGAIGAIALGFVAAAAIWKIGAWKLPFDGADIVLVFLSAALMGYANLAVALASAAIGALWMKARPNKKLPFFGIYLVLGAIWMLAIHFPGLVF